MLSIRYDFRAVGKMPSHKAKFYLDGFVKVWFCKNCGQEEPYARECVEIILDVKPETEKKEKKKIAFVSGLP